MARKFHPGEFPAPVDESTSKGSENNTPDFFPETCICPKPGQCDCADPGRLGSNTCPEHNITPDPYPGCPIHDPDCEL